MDDFKRLVNLLCKYGTNERGPWVDELVYQLLLPNGSAAIASLKWGLGQPNVNVVLLCLEVARYFGEKSLDLLPELSQLSQSLIRIVRIAAIQTIAELGPSAAAAIPMIEPYLTSEDFLERYYACQAVSDLNQRSNVFAERELEVLRQDPLIDALLSMKYAEAAYLDEEDELLEQLVSSLEVLDKSSPNLCLHVDQCLNESPSLLRRLTNNWKGKVIVFTGSLEHGEVAAFLAMHRIRYDEMRPIGSLEELRRLLHERSIGAVFDGQLISSMVFFDCFDESLV
jgi:hypothetical protein